MNIKFELYYHINIESFYFLSFFLFLYKKKRIKKRIIDKNEIGTSIK